MTDPYGRNYGPNSDLRESPYCYTLLETYLRFCTAPPRAFLQLGEGASTAAAARPARPRVRIALARARAAARSAEVENLTHWGEASHAAAEGGPARPLAAEDSPDSGQVVDGFGGFVDSLVSIIVDMITRIAKALVPAVVAMLMAPFYSVLVALPDLIIQRLIPTLLGAPVYPPRPAGYTGPDPYDPYGPDTPEPRPFPNPGTAMCRQLLEAYTGKCVFAA